LSRVLIIPAAGRGSRLQAEVPKFLYPIRGKPMIDRLIAMYSRYADCNVVVVGLGHLDAATRHFQRYDNVALATQSQPTGMLDAILAARDLVNSIAPRSIWITWCDQIALRQETLRRLADLTGSESQAPMTFPTVVRTDPYIHFARDSEQKIIGLFERREGDPMPDVGENDVGLFAMTRAAYDLLGDVYATDPPRGRATAERNFLPFIPWLARAHRVSTFPATDTTEAIGVNTSADAEALAGVIENIEHES